MDIDDLRAVQSKERRKDSLQHLRDSFYDDVAAYIAARREERDERAAAVDSPFSDSRVRKLSNEIETAEEVAESLYERRVGKVVKLASFAAADAPVDTDGMTTPELDLFEDLVERIRSNKESVLDVLADGPGADAADAGDGSPGATDAVDAADAGEATDDAAAAPSASPDRSATDADGDGSRDGNGDGGVLADAMGGDAADDGGDSHPQPPDPDGSPSAGAAADAGETTDDAATAPSGAGEADDGTGADGPDDPPRDDPPSDGRIRADPAPDGSPAAGAGGDATDDRTTVRITRDVGRILGVDEREYDLASEDVVSLPAANAGPLVERDAAEPLE